MEYVNVKSLILNLSTEMQALYEILICMAVYVAIWVVIFGWKHFTKEC